MIRCSEAETATNELATAGDAEEGGATSGRGKSSLEGREPHRCVCSDTAFVLFLRIC